VRSAAFHHFYYLLSFIYYLKNLEVLH
jgi:hypothetical protein